MNRATVRDAATVVRTEVRVRWRAVRDEPRKLLAFSFPLLLFGLVFPYWVRDAVTAFGRNLAGPGIPVGTAGATFTGLAIAGAYLGGSGGLSQEGGGAVDPLVRTSIPPDTVSLGRLASEVGRGVAFLVPSVVVLLVLVGLGAGGPTAPLAFALAAAPLFLAGILVGRFLGDCLRYVNRFVGLSLWTKAFLLLVGTAAAFVATQLFFYSAMDDSDVGFQFLAFPAFLPGRPMQAYAETALLPLGGSVGPPGAFVAVLAVLSVPLALVATVGFESRLLLLESSAEEDAVEGTSGVPRPFTVGPSARVAWRYLLRSRRDPRTLAHLTPLLFGGMAMGASIVQDPAVAYTLVPATAVIGGATIAGAAYCLNPLGDDVDQLPFLVTSTASSAVLLRGRALAGAVIGLVLAVGIGAPVALVEHSVAYVVWLSFLAVVLCAGGAGVALGLGALFPKFENREYMSVERPHPSNYALFGLLFGGMAVGGLGLLLVAWTVGGAPGAAVGAGWTLYLLVVGGCGLAGYVYAVRTFDDQTLDDV